VSEVLHAFAAGCLAGLLLTAGLPPLTRARRWCGATQTDQAAAELRRRCLASGLTPAELRARGALP